MPAVWGKVVDENLLPDAQSLQRSQAARRDLRSAAGQPEFIDPAHGDFRVQNDSPALKLGFKNFAMDHFGVTSPKLRAEARSPQIPALRGKPAGSTEEKTTLWLGAKVKSVTNLDEVSAAGLPSLSGVILLDVPSDSAAAKAGLKLLEVIVGCDGQPVKTFSDLNRITASRRGKSLKLEIYRGQKPQIVEISAGDR
jgi:membrane-associated protease RseP (regulator of RpoE activity)